MFNVKMKSCLNARFLYVFVALLMLSSCRTTSRSVLSEYMEFDVPAQRAKNLSNVKIYVSSKQQTMYVMEKGNMLLATPVCVGKQGSPTPYGNFVIQTKEKNHRSNTHGWGHHPKANAYVRCFKDKTPSGWEFISGPLPYWLEFSSPAYGLHTGYIYPYPKSNGCIRMHANVAPKVFELCLVGTPVSIEATQEWDANIGSKLDRPVNPEIIEDNPAMECSPRIFNDHKAVTWDE